MPAISVIIPTFNHGGLVLQTLESVFAQTFSDYEVIVVNDGSPDNTAQVLAPLAQAGRIIYVEQPNAGQAAARNRGFAEAKGQYIAFLDDDDWWPADKLEWQINALRADAKLGVVADPRSLDTPRMIAGFWSAWETRESGQSRLAEESPRVIAHARSQMHEIIFSCVPGAHQALATPAGAAIPVTSK